MSFWQLLGVGLFSALCWGHGYTRGRMDSVPQLSRQARAYLQGRRDERAIAEKEERI
jgi:hypothetical protein